MDYNKKIFDALAIEHGFSSHSRSLKCPMSLGFLLDLMLSSTRSPSSPHQVQCGDVLVLITLLCINTIEEDLGKHERHGLVERITAAAYDSAVTAGQAGEVDVEDVEARCNCPDVVEGDKGKFT